MRRLSRSALLGCALMLGVSALPSSARGQAGAPENAERAGAAARDAQNRFERDRVPLLPVDHGWGSDRCDEVIGRMCYSDEEASDWYGFSENPSAVAAREALIAELAEAALHAPEDSWILGQRVFYLGEAGRWNEAAELAAACVRDGSLAVDPSPSWAWCRALEGLALHGLGRFVESETAFRRALSRMDPHDVGVWSDPEPLLGTAARGWWRGMDPDERARRGPAVWALVDPLLLVPGNDLLTEFWARRTMARVREEARNPYGMGWGSDLEEMLVRYGWEVGWGRRLPSTFSPPGSTHAVGYHHPESRALVPLAPALITPAAASETDWIPDARRARSAYAPAYAPVLLPGAGRVAVFPRGDRIAVVGAFVLPEDTTFHAGHDHPARDSVPLAWRGRPSEAGLFLLPADDPAGAGLERRLQGTSTGAVLLEAPAGRWVVSLEVLSPGLRRAGRTRLGLDVSPRPPDVFTVSDVLLVDGVLGEGATLETSADRALARAWFRSGERIAVAWELFGLGYRSEVLSYRLTVERADEGVLGTVARWLGLGGSARTQALEWDEGAPDRPGPTLRSVELELPPLPAGSYWLRLEVETQGRAPLVREVPIELRP